MKTIFRCCKKKKKEKEESYISEIHNILTKKRNLIQLDSMKFSPNKGTIINNTNIIQDKNELYSKSFACSHNKMRIKTSFAPNTNPSTKKESKKNKKFLHEFKDKLRCMFCGGRDCKHEDYLNNIENDNAIEGLNSNFVTNEVIASQRPSEVLIQEFELVSKFKQYDIGLIVNLQREGEHPYCGPNGYNLTAAGYSYNPSMFTGDNIKCKLSGWKDMSVPSSMNFMLEIVKDMTHVVIEEKKRVLVHCHAGYGRTGVVIACYLLYNSDKNSEKVISEIRIKRKKCIESNDQQSFCNKFHDFLCQTRLLFDKKERIDVYLKRQEDLLFGNEAVKYGYIPKIITKTFEKIICLKGKYGLENVQIYYLMKGIKIEWDEQYENILDMLKIFLNRNNWELFDKIENLIIIVELMFDWFEDYVECLINQERTEVIVNNALFIEYQNNLNEKKENIKPELIEELFILIRKTYHCFEYEILFQFASFCALIAPINENDKPIFNHMIERMSYGLLGLPFVESQSKIDTNKSIESLIKGLSEIINLIIYSLSQEESENQISLLHPERKNTQILTSKKVKKNNSTTSNVKVEGPTQQLSESLPSSPLIKVLKTLTGLNQKEKKMLHTFEYLTNHFTDKLQTYTLDNSNNIAPLNEIIDEKKEEGSVSNLSSSNIEGVIEEFEQQKSFVSQNLKAQSPNKNLGSNCLDKTNVGNNKSTNDTFSNVIKNNLVDKQHHVILNDETGGMNAPGHAFTISNTKKSSLLTFESCFRSLNLNIDHRGISNMASGFKPIQTCGEKQKNTTNLINLQELIEDPSLKKELAEFKERKGLRQTSYKERNNKEGKYIIPAGIKEINTEIRWRRRPVSDKHLKT